MRTLLGFLLGFILGSVGSAAFLASGGGDYLIATSPRVRQLEAEMRQIQEESSRATKLIEELGQLTSGVADLERRVKGIESRLQSSPTP